jgi:hypothetical protein
MEVAGGSGSYGYGSRCGDGSGSDSSGGGFERNTHSLPEFGIDCFQQMGEETKVAYTPQSALRQKHQPTNATMHSDNKMQSRWAGCTALAERLRHLDGSDVRARVCHIHTTSCVERALIVQPPCGRAWVRVHRQRARQWDFWCRVLCVLITTHHSTVDCPRVEAGLDSHCSSTMAVEQQQTDTQPRLWRWQWQLRHACSAATPPKPEHTSETS